MRKHEKKQLMDLVSSLNEGIDYVFSNINQRKNAQAVLLDCYSGVSFIESFVDKDINISQKYCIVISDLKEQMETFNKFITDGMNCKDIFKLIKNNIILLENLLKNENPRIEAVFMPYKASMWDSLESIWMAADNDENCNAIVMPIPYFELNSDRTFGKMYYEGDDYPDYVPITNYNNYDLSVHMPDVIFIHNPYDDSNTTVSVHPMFYSDKLKEYTDMLVYVPYFVLYETEPDDKESIKKIEHFIKQPAMLASDKVIVQSEKMRKIYINELIEYTGFRDRKYWNDKISGLGSPKYDRLLRLKKEDLYIPESWINVIQKKDGSRKKIILYNTSIGSFLSNYNKYLKKMREVFEVFGKNREDTVLLWRPHPLLAETIKSACPWILDEFENITNEFKREKGWIYDDTSDIDRAIILSDAYYGDWSSVVMLYQKTGKPVMIQQIEDDAEEV